LVGKGEEISKEEFVDKRTVAVELGKELYLELFADMKQGNSYYSIAS
jgi:hypothetical protein|tara:strand:- start:1091 stop:1231 length:141 start_codon:yes stop_codon:yes gene_type:complete